MKRQTGTNLGFEDIGIDNVCYETRQAVEKSDLWSKDIEVAKAWYQASRAIGKDADYCESVREVLEAVLRGDSQSLRERIDEIYLCFGTLIRNWRNARNWMYQNETRDRQEHSRFISDLNALARTIRRKSCLQSVSQEMVAEAQRDLEHVESEKIKTDFSHLSSSQLESRK